MITQSENGLIISGINIYVLSIYNSYFFTDYNYFIQPYDWIIFGHIWNLFFLLFQKSLIIVNSKDIQPSLNTKLNIFNTICKSLWNFIGWSIVCLTYTNLHIFVILYMSIILTLNSMEIIEDLVDLI